MYIFTSGSIQNVPVVRERLDRIFKGIYSAEELNTSKKETVAYILISRLTKTAPNKVLFIDDDQQNLDAADSAGVNTIQFTNNTEVISRISELYAKDE